MNGLREQGVKDAMKAYENASPHGPAHHGAMEAAITAYTVGSGHDALVKALREISRLAKSNDLVSLRFQLNVIADHADAALAKAGAQ